MENEFMSYEEAKIFVQNLKFKTLKEFSEWSISDQRPNDFPDNVYITYMDELKSFPEFLGYRAMRKNFKEFMSYEEAKVFIQKQNLKSKKEFDKWSSSDQRPINFPSKPSTIYSGDFETYSKFLGYIAKGRYRNYMSYEEAKVFIQKINFRSSWEFKIWSSSGQRPNNFPSSPHVKYEEEFEGYSEFLGYPGSRKLRDYLTYEDAKVFIQKYNFKSIKEYSAWLLSNERPSDFPGNVYNKYRKEFEGYPVFLGYKQ